jgi:hypothetical protein
VVDLRVSIVNVGFVSLQQGDARLTETAKSITVLEGVHCLT